MTMDLPPPYTALARHPMMPRTSHDEAALFNFLTHFNRYVSSTLGRGNHLAYDTRVLPAFRAEHGRDPVHRNEIRDAMNRDSFHRTWSALKRNSMEMRQVNGRQTVLRQLDELMRSRGSSTSIAVNWSSILPSGNPIIRPVSTSIASREAIIPKSDQMTSPWARITMLACLRRPAVPWGR